MSPRNAERDADTEFCFTRMLVITNFRFYVVVLVVARSDLSVKEMKRCLKVGGYVMSVSGVLPEDHRRNIFPVRDWEWVRDGTDDLKAGCFILRRKR